MQKHKENIHKIRDGHQKPKKNETRRINSQKFGIAPDKSTDKNMLVENIMWEWLENNRNYIKTSTYQRYESIIKNHISASIGQLPVRFLSVEQLHAFTDECLRKPLSKQTVNHILTVLCMGLSFAKEAYNISSPKVHLLKISKNEMRVLSNEEQKILVSYLLKELDICKFGVLLALYTGLRIGEVCALQWEDISKTGIHVHSTAQRLKDVSGKTKVIITEPKTETSNRLIPIPPLLLPFVNLYRKSSGFVLQQKNGKYIEPRLLQIKFANYIKECNLSDVTFHTLRHTFATRCIESGFDAKSLSEILGHTDVKITLNRYVHSSYELKKKNMAKLSFDMTI